ncbi:MAG: ATP-binding protein [Deltaproteobacteria bacterium]|nr:ATP-binding protein [Deltaproteobacteria bacterium]
MREIADHILDIAENSLRAGANDIVITVEEETNTNKLRITIVDNGMGMDEEQLKKIFDPFYTTKSERKRKFGLGLPLLMQMAQESGGGVQVNSQKGKGTTVIAEFGLRHIDRQPLGDIAGTFVTLLLTSPLTSLTYIHRCGKKAFEISTSEIKKQIDEALMTDVAVLAAVREIIVGGIKDLASQA